MGGIEGSSRQRMRGFIGFTKTLACSLSPVTQPCASQGASDIKSEAETIHGAGERHGSMAVQNT